MFQFLVNYQCYNDSSNDNPSKNVTPEFHETFTENLGCADKQGKRILQRRVERERSKVCTCVLERGAKYLLSVTAEDNAYITLYHCCLHEI